MEDYSAKLTGEPFLYNETKTIAKFLLNGEDREQLRKRNIEENLIKHKFTYGALKSLSFGDIYLLAMQNLYSDFSKSIENTPLSFFNSHLTRFLPLSLTALWKG